MFMFLMACHIASCTQTPGCLAASDTIGSAMNPSEQLDALLPGLDEATRRALMGWAGQQAIRARMEEIELFASAACEVSLDSGVMVAAYFAGRLLVLAAQLEPSS